jgi:hypothetical protein
MTHRPLAFALSLLVCGFGPCSEDAPPAKTDKDDKSSKDEGDKKPKKKKKADDDEDVDPAELVKKNADQGWSGHKTATTPQGTKWKIDVWNCGKDPKGPWKAHFSMDASQKGMTMTGESSSWHDFTFVNDTKPVASVVKVKVKASSGPSGVNMNLDSSTNVELTLQPGTSITIKEKAATGGVNAKGPQGETASWFGGGEGNDTQVIPITPGCADDFVPVPLVPEPPKKK